MSRNDLHNLLPPRVSRVLQTMQEMEAGRNGQSIHKSPASDADVADIADGGGDRLRHRFRRHHVDPLHQFLVGRHRKGLELDSVNCGYFTQTYRETSSGSAAG